MKSRLLLAAALSGALAVILGAFGAHALEHRLAERALEVWQTANRYHFFHSLGLLGLGLWEGSGRRGAGPAGLAWILGMALFCGGLYTYALTGLKLGAMVAPLGGLSLAAGWLALIKLKVENP
jgi:uncharacterized membrane protein YgdD (TMEM256/DUF423 family)